MHEYRYTVDLDGRVFHDGTEIVDPAVLRFFLLAMQRTEDGRYLVLCQGERNWFQAPDTPFVVQRVLMPPDGPGPGTAGLVLAGGYTETLDPATLEAEAGHLYCRVRRGAFRARFGRIAVQQIAPHLAERAGGLALLLDGTAHPIVDR